MNQTTHINMDKFQNVKKQNQQKNKLRYYIYHYLLKVKFYKIFMNMHIYWKMEKCVWCKKTNVS